jgi:hypothetical protein
MKSFKAYLNEKQKKHDDGFLLLSNDIKIDRENACKIWDKCGQRDKFRHITDIDGAEFLIKNTNKDVTISALKFSKETQGIETDGSVILMVDADYEVWFPADAFSYIGEDGKRWVSKSAVGYNNFIPMDFQNDYNEALRRRIKKFRELDEFLEDMDGWGYYQLSSLTPVNSMFESKLSTFTDKYPHKMSRFTKDGLTIQRRVLDKYSDEITSNLVKLFNKGRNNKDTRRFYKQSELDEALVSNVEVKKIVFTNEDPMRFIWGANNSTDIKAWYDSTKRSDSMKLALATHAIKKLEVIVDRLKKINFKGQFTFVNTYGRVYIIKDVLKPKFNSVWKFLEKELGIVRDRGIYLRLK